MSKENVFRVGTNPKLRCSCGQCGKRATTIVANTPDDFVSQLSTEQRQEFTTALAKARQNNQPAEFAPVDPTLMAAALAAPKPVPLTDEQRNAAITKHNEPLAVVDHSVTTGRDGQMQRNGVAVKKETK